MSRRTIGHSNWTLKDALEFFFLGERMVDTDGSLNNEKYFTDTVFFKNIVWIYRDIILTPENCSHIRAIWQRLREDPQYPHEHMDIAVVYIMAKLCAEFSKPRGQPISIDQEALFYEIKRVHIRGTPYRQMKKNEIQWLASEFLFPIYSKMQQLELEYQAEWRWNALQSAFNAYYIRGIPSDLYSLLRESIKQTVHENSHEFLGPTPGEWSFNKLNIQIDPQEAIAFINSRFEIVE